MRRLDRTASWTAQFNAAQRAAETMQPPECRLLDDRHAASFVTDPMLRFALTHRLVAHLCILLLDGRFGGLHAHTVLRARYADDELESALSAGIDQLVLLGAGFDTTGRRHHLGQTMAIFEVDAPTTQSAKRASVNQQPALAKSDSVVWVACDFERDSVKDRLLAAGFDRTKPALVIWLGVTFYLTIDAINASLAELTELCAPASRLILDYCDPGVVDGTTRWAAGRRAARAAGRRGEIYRTGLTALDVDKLVDKHGFAPRGHSRVPALLDRYDPHDRRRLARDDWIAIAAADRL